MSANVPTTLDFEQALHTFRTAVTPRLEIGEVAAWDGRQFLTREQAIVGAALVLAGQCIVLLVWRLAQSAAIQALAVERTADLRVPTSVGHGLRALTVLTFGNVNVPLRLPYVRQRAGGAEAGFYPFLKWSGIEEGLTPLAWTTVAEYGVVQVSFEVARGLLQTWGLAACRSDHIMCVLRPICRRLA